ncbi:23S rRNA m(5)U-1939 methyltransferase [Roseovarius nanhaiticus]|uniref:23S rRNA m(5)U-1939 methyltransferase n=1 Tax=Roseovarius nanhaiticus TaxID=573024 RepID=A0A1N7EIV8_9RHOB|nr:class I SAM-dependent RNA methyltransferase [Roseovarius nanhaiticus]SEK73913.1 23S rRNA m(5)U-1939 methyltransferase [Roseovarius nanhaiticus]SIR87905.1 23S rRNA m(5)U-1939 methyltransferase [Roseovarius nanhaiticus]
MSHLIERLGHQGDGIAAGPVFAPMTLPGERVTGVLDGQRLTDIRIETPSDRRVAPPCRHFKACGGCQLQHADDAFVAQFKEDVVRTALAAHGVDTVFLPIATSPAQARRRATLSARRTKKAAMAGFHGRASDVIIEIPDCRLLHPDLMRAIPVAEALAQHAGTRKGTLDVAVCLSQGGLDVNVTGGKDLDGPLRALLAQMAETLDLARLAWEGEVIAMRQAPLQRFGAALVTPPPGAFLQATSEGETALLADVQDALKGATRIVDLFAGCGTFALPLCAAARVHAVEGDAAMTEAMDAGWRKAEGLKQLSVEARDLFRRPLLPDELSKFDGAVIDPPRAGAEAQMAQLIAARVPRIAYVSCNAVTFARNAAAAITAGYRLEAVRVVDQFRWSSHVELVARLTLI